MIQLKENWRDSDPDYIEASIQACLKKMETVVETPIVVPSKQLGRPIISASSLGNDMSKIRRPSAAHTMERARVMRQKETWQVRGYATDIIEITSGQMYDMWRRRLIAPTETTKLFVDASGRKYVVVAK